MIGSASMTPQARAQETLADSQPSSLEHGRLLDPLFWNLYPPSLPASNQPPSLQILDQDGHQHHKLGATFPLSPIAETLQYQSHRYTNDNYPSQQFSPPESQSLNQYLSPYPPSYRPLSAFEQSHSFSTNSSGPDKSAESFFAGTEHQENIVNSNSHQEESSGVFSVPESFVPLELGPFSAESQQTTFGFEQSYLCLGGLNPSVPAGPFFASPENQENTISGNSYQEQLNRGSSTTRSQSVDLEPFVPYWGPFLPENQQPIFSLEQEQSQYPYATTNSVLAIPSWSPFTAHQESAINGEFPQENFSNISEPINPRPPNNPSRSSVTQTPENAIHGGRSTPSQNFRCSKCLGPLAGPHKCLYEGRTLTIWCRGNNDKCLQKLTKRSDFNRHWNDVHADVELIRCPVPGCKKGFKRKDNLTQHRRLFHEQFIAKNRIRYGGGNARDSGSAEVESVEG